MFLQDFSEENVLKSLTTLNQILADAHTSTDLGATWTQTTAQNKKTSLPVLTKIHSKRLKDDTAFTQPGESVARDVSKLLETTLTAKENTPSSDETVAKLGLKFDNLEVESFISDDMRPRTPVSVSAVEPCFSKVARSGSAPCEAGEGVRGVSSEGVTEMDALNESTLESRRQLTVAEEK